MAQHLAKPSRAQKQQEVTVNDVPHCSKALGTLSIVDGDDPSGWTQFQLAAPQKLLRVLVQRSGCFKLVDRGSGLSAAQHERDIGGGLGLQHQSNVGQGQIKAADYVLIAEVQSANKNSSGSGVGAGIGGIIGGSVGGLLGGISSRKQEANTVLSLTNVRTTETIATTDGYAAKNSLSFGGGGSAFAGGIGGGAVGGGYDNTDIGRIVTLAFIQAYTKMVNDLGLINQGDASTAQATPTKLYTATAPVAMRATASATGKVIRSLASGSSLYPTGNKNGLWWEVADENDNVGWVLNTKLESSHGTQSIYDAALSDAELTRNANVASLRREIQNIVGAAPTISSAGAAPGARTPDYFIVDRALKLRDYYSFKAKVLGIVAPGARVIRTGSTHKDWMEILDPNNVRGWIWVRSPKP